ncbi:4-hydroxy-tetrahydrodipicolinate synthase [Lysinibacillus sp. FSL H8-0500]|uniref:4-hydroxy-tetrahydrodipicolinate synthase n=1 Tax=Lysinibacillus sp. FSL H8-0500 TaxID=2921393 RepID=UPI00310122FD
MKYNGIMTALVTPLHQDGTVDQKNFAKLIEDQLNNNIHTLLVLGGTGEYAALTMEQRKVAIDVAIKASAGRVPVVVGLLSPGIGDNVELGNYAKQAGADAVMIVTPYYVNPTRQGFIEYYQELDRRVDMPIILYNIPYKTGIHLANDVVKEVVEKVPNVVGMKVCSDNIGDVLELLQTVGDKIAVLCGEDFRAVSSFIAGAPGAITASSNLLPDVWVQIYDFVQEKKYDEAVALHQKFFPLMKSLYKEGNPGPVKAALDMINVPVGSVSVPLVDASTDLQEELKQLLTELEVSVR